MATRENRISICLITMNEVRLTNGTRCRLFDKADSDEFGLDRCGQCKNLAWIPQELMDKANRIPQGMGKNTGLICSIENIPCHAYMGFNCTNFEAKFLNGGPFCSNCQKSKRV